MLSGWNRSKRSKILATSVSTARWWPGPPVCHIANWIIYFTKRKYGVYITLHFNFRFYTTFLWLLTPGRTTSERGGKGKRGGNIGVLSLLLKCRVEATKHHSNLLSIIVKRWCYIYLSLRILIFHFKSFIIQMEMLCSSLSFLHRNCMPVVLVHGPDPNLYCDGSMYAQRQELLEQEMHLVDCLEKYYGTTRTFCGSGIVYTSSKNNDSSR